MPGFSTVRVEVQGSKNLPVRIWKDDWDGLLQLTGSRPDFGEFALEFSPLGPGIYMIEPEGLDIFTDVELTGLEAVWVSFRSLSQATSPNIVSALTLRQPQKFTPPQSSSTQTSPPVLTVPPVVIADAAPPVATQLSSPPKGAGGRETYLWVDNQALSGALLTALLRYVAEKQPGVGSRMHEATQARRVQILGDESYFTQPECLQLEKELSRLGIHSERLQLDDLLELTALG